ncbi:hypothetical protein E1262_12200 [Jiangella aurantiaca]|uniref:Uncharacterized protein n=1 Tax=Jiangella aurantiaca TaxID=2530373 RepID=A0A4R5ABH5_9ACTN|nr:hypothetical protein [Jiangella aurantiaca]TDD69708.1 hypothetical protein E1262_12200 [Jiangella aurantiaca]
MIEPHASDIRRIDQTLRELAKDLRRHDDPVDALQISESMDALLDERLELMHEARSPGLFSFERSWNPSGR